MAVADPCLRVVLCGLGDAEACRRQLADALPGWVVGRDGAPASPPAALCVWIGADATPEQIGRAAADAGAFAAQSPLVLLAEAGFDVEEAAPQLAEAATALLRTPLDLPAVRALFRGIARARTRHDAEALSADLRRVSDELARAQFAMDHVLDAVYWATFDGRIAYANRAVRSMLGYEPDEVQPLSVFDVMGPEELKQWPAMWDAMRAGGLIALEGFHRTKSGAMIPVEVRANLMTYEGVEYGCAVVRDISGRKQDEAALADADARFRALSEEASWGVFVAHEGRLTYVNQALAAMLGHTREELIGVDGADLALPDDRAIIEEHVRRALEGETGPMRYQARGMRSDGEVRDFEVVGVTTSLSGQHAFIGTLTDITERLRSERRLAQMNRALRCINACRAAVSQAPDERSMLAEVCRAIVEVGGHRLAWVGYAEDDADQTVRPVAWAGDPGDYQSSGPILWSDTPRGRGPTGTAIRTGKAAVVNSYADDPELGHWRAEGLSRGFKSSIALPLRTDAGVIGAVTIYSDRDQAFDGDEAQLLREMVDGVGVGITAARARAARDEAELRLRSLGDNLPGSMIYQIHALPGEPARVTYVSAGIWALFGITVEEANRSPEALMRYVSPEDQQRMAEALARSAQDLQAAEVEIRWHAPGGDPLWRLMRAMPRRLEDGSTAWDGVVLDITETKRTEEAALVARAKLEAAIESLGDALFITDSHGTVIDFNTAFATFHRFASRAECPTTMAGWQQALDILTLEGEAIPADGVLVQRALRGESKSNVEYMLRRRDTGETWIGSYSFAPIRGAGGAVVGSVVLVRDVTEAKLAATRLREAEQRRDLALDAGQMATWDWDLRTGRARWSGAHGALLGLDGPIESGTPDAFFSRVHSDDLPGLYGLAEESRAAGTPFRTEFRVVWPNGTVRWLTSQGRHEYDADGNATRLHGVTFDITERRTAEERVRRLGDLQASLLGAGSLNEKLQAVAQGLVSIFGADFARIWLLRPGDRCLAGCVHAEADADAHRCPDHARCLHMVASAGRYTNIDGPLRSRVPMGLHKLGAVASGATDGISSNNVAHEECVVDHDWAAKHGLVAMVVRPFRPHDGDALGVMAVFWRRPISPEEEALVEGICSLGVRLVQTAQAEEALRESREQLLQAQKMESVGTLAGGIAHDFNNLLMGIIGYLELCGDHLDALHPSREHLDEALAQAHRSADLTRRLLAFARKETAVPRIIDLSEAVGHMLKMLGRVVGENIDLIWTPSATPCILRIDPSQVDQVLANLTINARDAIRGVGTVTIATEAVEVTEAGLTEHAYATPGSYVSLTVSDTGCGMDEATMGRIFEPFYTTKGLGQGTGLGLATVYGIVKQNDGFIGVVSRPGVGSTFRILWPRASGEPVEVAPAAQPGASGGTETILLAEDEKSIRVTTRAFLKAAGYVVLAAPDPAEALQLAAGHEGRIDLLLTDMVMPGMTGAELAQQLTAARPDLRVLYMSGYSADAIAAKGAWDKSLDLLTKPFGKAVLLQKVREVLDRE